MFGDIYDIARYEEMHAKWMSELNDIQKMLENEELSFERGHDVIAVAQMRINSCENLEAMHDDRSSWFQFCFWMWAFIGASDGLTAIASVLSGDDDLGVAAIRMLFCCIWFTLAWLVRRDLKTLNRMREMEKLEGAGWTKLLETFRNRWTKALNGG